MNLLSWNCRGMGNPRAVRVFGDLLKSRNPDFVFLCETLVDASVINNLVDRFGFHNSFVVDRTGRGGGLAIMWKKSVLCQVLDSSSNHINLNIMDGVNISWRLTCFYGFPERTHRQESWEFLRSLASNITIPWCVFGDFNDMLFASDKQGTHPHPQSLLNGFRLAIEDCGFSELSLNGGAFTWEKSKGSSNWVREKLDTAFANAQWWRKFPLCNLSVTHTIYSDHDPIILEPLVVTWSRKQFRFKFENTWLNEPSFKNKVATYWKSIPPMQMLPKLLSVSSFMVKWGRNFFHKFRDKVKLLKETIALLVNRTDDIGIKQYFEEKNKLDELLYHEELYWKQRVKSFWLTEGDTNSKYFHAAATKRKKINHISQLLNAEGSNGQYSR